MSKKTLLAAKKTGNHLIVQVKDNQKTLLRDCQRNAATRTPQEVFEEPWTKARNRLEKRRVELFFYPLLTDCLGWATVKVIIKVTRWRRQYRPKTKTWHNSDEVSYYISTAALSAAAFGAAIRNHWGTENRNHYVRDVTLGEDASRIRINPHIFAKLRSFALNILRKNQVENVSVAIYDNCMQLERVLNYIGIKEN